MNPLRGQNQNNNGRYALTLVEPYQGQLSKAKPCLPYLPPSFIHLGIFLASGPLLRPVPLLEAPAAATDAAAVASRAFCC